MAVFFGTLAPFLRASERPMAIACFRLLTLPPLPPLPERSVPLFFRRIALATLLPAALPFWRRSQRLRELVPFVAAMCFLLLLRAGAFPGACCDAGGRGRTQVCDVPT